MAFPIAAVGKVVSGISGAKGAVGGGGSSGGGLSSMMGNIPKPPSLGDTVAGVYGAASVISGKRKLKKAEKAMPSLVDPSRAAALEEARRKQRQVETGTDATTQAALRENEQMLSGTQAGIAQSTGGNIGSTISGLLGAQRMAGSNVNNIYASSAPRAQYFGSLADQISQEIANRKKDIQFFKSQQYRAEGAAQVKGGTQNLFMFASKLGGNKGNKAGQTQPFAPNAINSFATTPTSVQSAPIQPVISQAQAPSQEMMTTGDIPVQGSAFNIARNKNSIFG